MINTLSGRLGWTSHGGRFQSSKTSGRGLSPRVTTKRQAREGPRNSLPTQRLLKFEKRSNVRMAWVETTIQGTIGNTGTVLSNLTMSIRAMEDLSGTSEIIWGVGYE